MKIIENYMKKNYRVFSTIEIECHTKTVEKEFGLDNKNATSFIFSQIFEIMQEKIEKNLIIKQ